MDFLKTGCEDKGCDFCVSWSGLPINRGFQSVPDTQMPSHYMHVSNTPINIESGVERKVLR